MSERLSGTELEKWFSKFARQQGIAASVPPASKVLAICNKYINVRFKAAREFVNGKIAGGWGLTSSLLEKPNQALSPELDEKLSRFYLDRAVATDEIVVIRDDRGSPQRISVDVTAEPEKQKEKINRVMGYPEKKNDGLGQNRNLNLPQAREELGSTKHLILVLNNEIDKLPSHEVMLDQLQAFANDLEPTKLVVLRELPESQLFHSRPRYWQNPQRLFENYSAKATDPRGAMQLLQIARQAYKDGHPQERVVEVLKQHPMFQATQGQKSPYGNPQVISERVANKQYEEYLGTHRQFTSETCRDFLELQGRSSAVGLRFEGNNYVFESQGDSLSISAKDGRGLIFEETNDSVVSRMLPEDMKAIQDLKKHMNFVEKPPSQIKSQAPQIKPKAPSPEIEP